LCGAVPYILMAPAPAPLASPAAGYGIDRWANFALLAVASGVALLFISAGLALAAAAAGFYLSVKTLLAQRQLHRIHPSEYLLEYFHSGKAMVDGGKAVLSIAAAVIVIVLAVTLL